MHTGSHAGGAHVLGPRHQNKVCGSRAGDVFARLLRLTLAALPRLTLAALLHRAKADGVVFEDTAARGKPIVFMFGSRPFTGGMCKGAAGGGSMRGGRAACVVAWQHAWWAGWQACALLQGLHAFNGTCARGGMHACDAAAGWPQAEGPPPRLTAAAATWARGHAQVRRRRWGR